MRQRDHLLFDLDENASWKHSLTSFRSLQEFFLHANHFSFTALGKHFLCTPLTAYTLSPSVPPTAHASSHVSTEVPPLWSADSVFEERPRVAGGPPLPPTSSTPHISPTPSQQRLSSDEDTIADAGREEWESELGEITYKHDTHTFPVSYYWYRISSICLCKYCECWWLLNEF